MRHLAEDMRAAAEKTRASREEMRKARGEMRMLAEQIRKPTAWNGVEAERFHAEAEVQRVTTAQQQSVYEEMLRTALGNRLSDGAGKAG